jgi:hypothetical protein
MQLTKLLMTLGGALVTSRFARNVSDFDLNDALGLVGLSRRESHIGQGLLIFSGGALVGAGVALLLAPASGKETRRLLGERIDKLSDAASDTLRDIQEEVPALLGREQPNQGSSSRKGVSSSAHSPA